MTEKQKIELLKSAYIHKELWDKCYIADDKKIFSPTDTKTAQEVYQEWLDNKQIDILPQTKTVEELTKENQQLWQTVEFLLKNTGFISSEEV